MVSDILPSMILHPLFHCWYAYKCRFLIKWCTQACWVCSISLLLLIIPSSFPQRELPEICDLFLKIKLQAVISHLIARVFGRKSSWERRKWEIWLFLIQNSFLKDMPVSSTKICLSLYINNHWKKKDSMGLVSLRRGNLPRSGMEPVSPALASGLCTSKLPGIPIANWFLFIWDTTLHKCTVRW